MPSHTHPEAVESVFPWEPESTQDSGNNSFVLHTLPSSCKDSWKAGLVGSEMSARTCAASERRVGRGGLDTHIIEILYEPRQITPLEGWETGLILVSAKEVNEQLMKLWRGSVEVVERL